MARTKATNMRVGAELHAASSEVFEALGIGMAAGINLFVNQCAIRGRMPFEVRAVEGMPVLLHSIGRRLLRSRMARRHRSSLTQVWREGVRQWASRSARRP